PGVAERAGGGGEADQEVQVRAGRRLVQGDQAGDLRGQHAADVGRVLADDVVVPQDAGAVQHTAQRRVRSVDAGDDGGDGRPVGDVELAVGDAGAGGGE